MDPTCVFNFFYVCKTCKTRGFPVGPLLLSVKKSVSANTKSCNSVCIFSTVLLNLQKVSSFYDHEKLLHVTSR